MDKIQLLENRRTRGGESHPKLLGYVVRHKKAGRKEMQLRIKTDEF